MIYILVFRIIITDCYGHRFTLKVDCVLISVLDHIICIKWDIRFKTFSYHLLGFEPVVNPLVFLDTILIHGLLQFLFLG